VDPAIFQFSCDHPLYHTFSFIYCYSRSLMLVIYSWSKVKGKRKCLQIEPTISCFGPYHPIHTSPHAEKALLIDMEMSTQTIATANKTKFPLYTTLYVLFKTKFPLYTTLYVLFHPNSNLNVFPRVQNNAPYYLRKTNW